MSVLQRLLLKLYGSSQHEQDERTRATAEAVAQRARERREELGTSSVDYSRTVLDAYRNSARRNGGEQDS